MRRLFNHIGSLVANNIAFETFVGLLEHANAERKNLFRVLTYHRVNLPESSPWLDPVLISATPESFEAQMKYLANNYEVVSASDVVKAFEGQGQAALPPRAVMLTFDDAYRDFEVHAWPVLKQYRLPVTLYVPTAFPDHPERLFWWDRLFNAINTTGKDKIDSAIGRFSIVTAPQRKRAHKRLKGYIKTLSNHTAMKEVEHLCNELGVFPQPNCVLGWDSLRKLAKEGVTLGAHTRTHPILNTISLDDMQTETSGSILDLQRETGMTPQTFAYPSGFHNNDAVKTVENAGLALAFTTEPGINEVGHADRFRLRRINVSRRTTIPILRAQFLYSKFVSPNPV